MKKQQSLEVQEATKTLKKLLKDGNFQVFTSLEHVSRSGMSRRISAYTIIDNRPVMLNWYIDKLGLFKLHKSEAGLVVGGCGMDMGFHLVYTLSAELFGYSDRGGYKLKQEWI